MALWKESFTNGPRQVLFTERNSWDAWSRLARPPKPARAEVGRPRLVALSTTKLSTLESLPAELLAVILDDSALERKDIIAVGLASESLWLHVIQHVERECQRKTASWAGVEIACTGSYLTDLPEPFERDGLIKSSVAISEWGEMCLARKMNWAAVSHYDRPGIAPESAWREAFDAQLGATPCVPKVRARMGDELLSAASKIPASSLDLPWALRDLNTQEYVRYLPRSGERQGLVDHPKAGGWLRLEDILMMRFCWTLHNSPYSDLQDSSIHRGKWAGHCFDIVLLQEESMTMRREGWNDITDEIVTEALNLWSKPDPERVYNIARATPAFRSKKRKSRLS